MKRSTNGLLGTRIAIVLAILLVGLIGGNVSAQTNPYSVHFDGVDYDVANNTSTWKYTLTWNGTGAALSHFSLEFCANAEVVAAFPSGYKVGIDPSLLNNTDCADTVGDFWGIKWDVGTSGLPAPGAGQSVQVWFTLDGLYKEGLIRFAAKAATNCNLGYVAGPSIDCEEIGYPICSLDKASDQVCEGESATFTGSAGGGLAPYSFSWTGPGEFAASTQSITVGVAGTYVLTVTDALGQVSSGCEANLTVHDLPTPQPGNYEFCAGSSVELDAGAGFSSYVWNDGVEGQTRTVSEAGTYTVTVTNVYGCSATADHVVTENALPEPPDSSQEICEGGTATLDAGDGFSSYLWSTGATTQTIDVTTTGTWTVTVTNDSDCSAVGTHSVQVNAPPEPPDSSQEICEGETATLDAGAGFKSYLWSTGATTQTIEVTTTGTWTVTVTNDNDCSAVGTHSVQVNALPEPPDSSQEICEGETATLDAGAGFKSYLWSTGATTQTIEVTTAGTYTVTVTNDNDCSATGSHEVIVNALPEPPDSSQEICEGETATLDAGDGFASYLWSTGETTQTIEVTAAGTYTVTVTNDNNCSATGSHEVIVNALPEPPDSSQEICEGETATLDAGDGFASYLWSTGETTQTIEVTEAGTYTVTVTNDSNCSAEGSHEVIVNALPEPSGSDFEICDGEEHTFDAGDGFSSYAWTGPNGEDLGTEQTITVSEAGTYTVTVTNENECSNVAYHELFVNDLPPAEITVGETCAGSINNSASTPDAGEGATYEWSIINGTITSDLPYGSTIMFTAGTDATMTVALSVTVTSAKGCVSSDDAEALNKACDEGCSLTQGAWGSAGGAGTIEQVQTLIGTGLVVGYGSNTFTVLPGEGNCLVEVLPAGGPAKALDGSGGFGNNCKVVPNDLIKKNTGNLNNVFLGQMLTLTLNTRDNEDLLNILLCATMTTQAVIHTADGDVLDPGQDGILGTDDDPIISVTIPQSVLDALDAAGLPRTVAGLLELGNMALGGVDVGASVSDVNKAIDSINIGFDECRIKIDCVPVATLSAAALQLVKAEVPAPLCRNVTSFNRSGFEQQFEIADSVIDGLRGLGLKTNLRGLAELAAMARKGQGVGVPIEDLNRVIDEINTIADEGGVIGCQW